ncbi:unnamed protein product [Closterium sp. Naga37s-1]|nr:unnamed protein product [Closterium sp. Naga37s-1]
MEAKSTPATSPAHSQLRAPHIRVPHYLCFRHSLASSSPPPSPFVIPLPFLPPVSLSLLRSIPSASRSHRPSPLFPHFPISPLPRSPIRPHAWRAAVTARQGAWRHTPSLLQPPPLSCTNPAHMAGAAAALEQSAGRSAGAARARGQQGAVHCRGEGRGAGEWGRQRRGGGGEATRGKGGGLGRGRRGGVLQRSGGGCAAAHG